MFEHDQIDIPEFSRIFRQIPEFSRILFEFFNFNQKNQIKSRQNSEIIISCSTRTVLISPKIPGMSVHF